MSEAVFILGAGASRDCGGPLMYDFLDRAAALQRSGAVRSEEEHFKRVFQAIGKLQAVFSKASLDIHNIESIFTALELADVIRSFPGEDPANIAQIIASLKRVIVVTLEQSIEFPLDGDRIVAPSAYEAFARLIAEMKSSSPSTSVSIITFNYDLAVDVSLFQESLEIDYCLDESDVIRSRTPDIELMKLHGSLNWAVEEKSKRIIPYVHFPVAMQRAIRTAKMHNRHNAKLILGSSIQEYLQTQTKDVKVQSEPVIVPPSWNKADYHRQLSPIWAKAASHLREAEMVFVIGYSLPETDSFFRHLYALGSVGDRPHQRIAIYDPNANAADATRIVNRFRSMIGGASLQRFEAVEAKFGKAVALIAQSLKLSL